MTDKVGTLGLMITNKNRCGAAKKRAKRARLAKAPSGAREANLGLPQVDSHKLRRSPVHLGYKGNLQRAKDPYQVPVKDSGRPAALPRGAC